MKFRDRGPKSEEGPLLWNKYVFFFNEAEKVGRPTFFLTTPFKNMSRSAPCPTGAHEPPFAGAISSE